MTISPEGVLTGTPMASGNYTVVVAVEDSSFDSVSAVWAYAINVSKVAIVSSPSYAWTQGTPVAVGLGLTGPSRLYNWSVNVADLPPGVRLDATGVLRGTPLTPGTYAFRVTVTDTNNSLNTNSANVTVVVAGAPATPPANNAAEGAFPWWLVVIIVLVLGAGGAYFVWNRRRSPK